MRLRSCLRRKAQFESVESGQMTETASDVFETCVSDFFASKRNKKEK